MHINHSIQREIRVMREIERIAADVHFRLDERRLIIELFESNAFVLTVEIVWLIKENLAAPMPATVIMMSCQHTRR